MAGIFSSLLDRMVGTPESVTRPTFVREQSSDSTISDVSQYVDTNAQSSSSTPPTSVGDSNSILSASMPLEKADVGTVIVPELDSESIPTIDPNGRSRRARTSVGTYNVKVLSGTAIHAPRKYDKNKPKITGNGEPLRRRTIAGDSSITVLESESLTSTTAEGTSIPIVSAKIDALNLAWSPKKSSKPRAQARAGNSARKARNSLPFGRTKAVRKSAPAVVENIIKKNTILGKRRRTTQDDFAEFGKARRELRNLADTNEYAKIEVRPVIYEVWSNGKLVTGGQLATKKLKTPTSLEKAAHQSNEAQRPEKPKGGNRKREKIWLPMGLYAGQEPKKNLNWFAGYDGDKDIPPFRPDGILPMPMWHGQKTLFVGRDFKLPFDVCSPLPPGQPKPDEWHKTSTNRFIGEAGALWKKSSLFDSFSSKCVCTPEGGCDEDCQNRIMLYECDDTNCASGREHCTNRAFAQLSERRKQGGKYRIGVEVIKTADRGYGVRSNRCFKANQIIVEYTGEIITEDECDRRMNEDYKDNECYYLMSFDQNMIIDATKGSIARFVNHSCKPNCRMVKWIVGGKPRMALFAGDHPIMSGDELTYDYNFDPFSAKNVQECRCGSDNCRGVLGPKPKDPKPVKEIVSNVLKAAAKIKNGVKMGKRKLLELLGDDGDNIDSVSPKSKKRKIKAVRGTQNPAKTVRSVKNTPPHAKRPRSTQSITVRRTVEAKRSGVSARRTKKVVATRTYKKTTKVSSVQQTSTPVTTPVEPRSSPRGKRPSQKFLESTLVEELEALEETEAEMAIKSNAKKRRSIVSEDSSTIRVLTDSDDEWNP